MKKLMTMLAMLFAATAAFAGGAEKMELKSGSVAELKEGGDVVVSVDFSKCTWDKKGSVKNHYSNFDQLKIMAVERFQEGFDDKAKKSKVVEKKSDAKWSINIVAENMDSFYNVMKFIPGHETKIWCTITVKEVATGKTAAVIYVEECDGGANMAIDMSFGDCFEALGEEIGKVFKKGKL